MKEKIIQTLKSLRKAIVSYPLFLASAFVMMLSVQYLIEPNSFDHFLIQKITLTASIGISLAFGVAMLSQRFDKAWLWNVLTLLFLGLFYFLVLPSEEGDFTEKYVYILIPCYILSHLFVAIAPFFKKNQEEFSFWYYNKTLFVNFFLTLVFTAILCGGIQLAILAISYLFSLNWDIEVYIRVYFGIIILGSALIYSLFHVDGLTKMEEVSPYPIVIAFFTQFILIPLLLLYATILYFYAIKIIWLWELPRGWVSYMILAYAVLGIFALLLVHPLIQGQSKSWVNIFKKLFYYTMIPLLILLYVAIGKRILDYGFTEARYFVLILAFWLSFISFYFVISKKTSLKIIPKSLFVMGIVTITIPYVNAYSLSIRSQKQNLKEILIKNDLLEDGEIVTNKPILSTVLESLNDKYVYLLERQQASYILDMLEEESRELIANQPYSFKDIFEKTSINSDGKKLVYFQLNSVQNVTELEGYNYMCTIEYEDSASFTIRADTLFVLRNLYGENSIFKMSVNDDKIDMMPMIVKLIEPYLIEPKNREVDNLTIQFDLSNYSCKAYFDNISVNYTSGEPKVFFNKVLFLFRRNESS